MENVEKFTNGYGEVMTCFRENSVMYFHHDDCHAKNDKTKIVELGEWVLMKEEKQFLFDYASKFMKPKQFIKEVEDNFNAMKKKYIQ